MEPSLGTDKGIADGSSLGIDAGNKLGEEEGLRYLDQMKESTMAYSLAWK